MNPQSLFYISEYSGFGKVKGVIVSEEFHAIILKLVIHSFIQQTLECCYPHQGHGQCNQRAVVCDKVSSEIGLSRGVRDE